jgi:hypothetical protein
VEFAEVRFFFGALVKGERLTLALVSLYSPPNPALLSDSYNTLWSCQYHGSDSFQVVNVKQIVSVVAMVPLPAEVTESGDSGEEDEESYFVVEKPGLEIFYLGGVEEDLSDDADDE